MRPPEQSRRPFCFFLCVFASLSEPSVSFLGVSHLPAYLLPSTHTPVRRIGQFLLPWTNAVADDLAIDADRPLIAR